ncbi:MAG: glycosyltransferase family 9 protein [Candidatus Margulisiibacteriota bacterium]
MTKKKAGIFISAGIGDAILLIPMVNHLKRLNFHVVGILTTQYPCEDIFNLGKTFDEFIIARTKKQLLDLIGNHRIQFHAIFLNFFAGSYMNLLVSRLISKKIFTNAKPKRFKAFKWLLFKVLMINYIEPVKSLHDHEQNIYLINKETKYQLSEDDISLNLNTSKVNAFKQMVDGPYIVIQAVSANNQVQFKNWPIQHWKVFFNEVCKAFPKIKFILLGDSNEVEAAEEVLALGHQNIESFVGKTTLMEVNQLIYQSKLLVGLDGGLMHIAASLGIPTLTIWGASSDQHYGYHHCFPKKHFIIKHQLSCQPCNLWINPNQSRVKNPELCPDFKCIREIKPKEVIETFKHVVRELGIWVV